MSDYENYALLAVLGLGGIVSYVLYFPAAIGLLYIGAVMVFGGTAGIIAIRRDASERTERLILSSIVIGFGATIAIHYRESWYFLVLGSSLILWGCVYGFEPSSLALGDGIVTIGSALAVLGAVRDQDIGLAVVFAAATIYGGWNVAQQSPRIQRELTG